MTVHNLSFSECVKCEVVVHGNGLCANVRAFDTASPESRLISLGALKSDNVIRLEMILEKGDWVTIQLGRVQWVDKDTVAVAIVQMDADDKRKLDEAAWSCVQGELKQFRWLRKRFRGDELRHIYISFYSVPNVQGVRLLEAA
jgi:hypothetical protein